MAKWHQKVVWKPFPDSHWRYVTLKVSPAAKKFAGDRARISRNPVRAHPQHRCCCTRITPEQHRGLRHSNINPNLLWMAARSALTLRANKPLVCSDCFIWLALSEVMSGQIISERTRWECHWPAEVLALFKFGLLCCLLVTLSYLKKKFLQQHLWHLSLQDYDLFRV